MGRKAKYATLRAYQPYIDAIRKDLGIPDSYYVNVRFGVLSDRGGYAKSHEIVIDKYGDKQWIVEALLHEFKHIQQMMSGRYKTTWIKSTRKNGRYKQGVVWEGKTYEFYDIRLAQRKGNMSLYRNQPWEFEAFEYEKEIDRLFPYLIVQAPDKRVFIGESSKGTKFYKVKGN